jgi:hypothetical protein
MEPLIGAEARGDHVAIFETNDQGARQEILVSRGAALQLSRLLPSLLRKIAASMLPAGPGRLVSAAIPIADIRLVEDLQHTEILLNIKDVGGGDFDFSMSPNHARAWGRALIQRADFVDQENAKNRGH